MLFYEIVVEQLDLAAELLQKQHAIQSRLALILIDNAVEYSLHRYATDYFALNTISGSLSVPERRGLCRRRAEATGQHFESKVAFARHQGAMTEDQATFVRNAHEFRNEAYHAGRAHDPIIAQLAAAYYLLFCEMLPKLAPRLMHFRLDRTLSDRVKSHLGGQTRTPMPDAEMIATSLTHAMPQVGGCLSDACRKSLVGQLSDIRGTIDYIIRNDTTAGDVESLILETQFWSALWGAAPSEGLTVRVNDAGVAEVDPDQKDQWEDALRQMRTTWSPSVSLRTFDRWERRIAALAGDGKPGALLQRYRQLQSEIDPFRRMLSDRCGSLDQHIDEVIERRSLGE